MKVLLALIISLPAMASERFDCRSWEKSIRPPKAIKLDNPHAVIRDSQSRLDRRTQALIDNFLDANQMEEQDLRQISGCTAAYGLPKLGLSRSESILRTTSAYEILLDDRIRCRLQVSVLLMDGFNEDIIEGICNGVKLNTPIIYHGSALRVLLPSNTSEH